VHIDGLPVGGDDDGMGLGVRAGDVGGVGSDVEGLKLGLGVTVGLGDW